jgi:predicted DNA-binding protein with PD1-like motif
MKHHVFRLRRGADLLESIAGYCREKRIQAGYAACCVGCVSEAAIRSADGATRHEYRERLEIVSLTGTVSEGRCHLHISFSREDMSVLGGHLLPGCVVNTTAEVVLCELPGLVFTKAYDENTGYNELTIEQSLPRSAHS